MDVLLIKTTVEAILPSEGSSRDVQILGGSLGSTGGNCKHPERVSNPRSPIRK